MHVPTLAAAAVAFDYSYFIHNGPVRIIAVASALSLSLQGAKRFIPMLQGKWALAANVALAIVGVLAVTNPANFWTVSTLGDIINASMVAAGIHGTAKLLNQAPDDDGGKTPAPDQQKIASGKFPVIAIAFLMLCTMGLAGCNGFERATYQTLSASKAVVDQAQADYEARTIPKSPQAYAAINKAKDAQTAAVQAMATYETIKYAKGTDAALSTQQAVVVGLLAKLPDLVAAVKLLYTPTPTPAALPAPVKPATGPTSMLRSPIPAAA
jgi:hypothetical protein